MKTYRQHYCDRKHRTYSTLAKCLWKRACWIDGNGEYALLAHCRVLTVSLWTNLADAEASKRMIDGSACGGQCYRRHEIIKITLP